MPPDGVKTAMPSRNLPKGWLAGTLNNTHWVLPSSFKHTSVLLFKKVLVPTTSPPSQPCPNLHPQTKRGGNCQGLHKSQDQRAGPLQNVQNKCKPSLNSIRSKKEYRVRSHLPSSSRNNPALQSQIPCTPQQDPRLPIQGQQPEQHCENTCNWLIIIKLLF